MKFFQLIFGFLIAFSDLDCTESFNVNGTITMDTKPDWATVAPGDVFLFTFDLQIDIEQENENLLLLITGDALEFFNDTSIEAVDWTLQNQTGDAHNRNASDIDIKEGVFTSDFRKGLSYMMNVTVGLTVGTWTLNGSYVMGVRDDVTHGSMIRSVVTITTTWDPYNVSSRTLASDYNFVPQPNISAESKSNSVQPIMALYTALVIFESERDVRECFLECYTEPEIVSKEVRLTVQRLEFSLNETYGTTPEFLEQLYEAESVKTSTLSSYQNNMANLKVPETPFDYANFSELLLASKFTVRIEDYSELEDGDQWPVFIGASFHSNVLWAGCLNVTIDAPVVRMPELSVRMSQVKQCAYDGETRVNIKLYVDHTPMSTGTAYNVTVNAYLTDYMKMVSRTYTEPRENQISVKQDGTVITSTITRLTFSDPFTLDVTLDLDLSNVQVKEAKERVVTSEALYNDRWSNVTDLLTETAYLSINANKICSKRLTWTSSSNCICSFNTMRSDCGCCVGGACQCGKPRPHACAPCDEMWRCVEYKEGFEKQTYLWQKGIRCDAFHLRRAGATGVSCHKKISNHTDNYLEISPLVAIVTGLDPYTGYLYGIANNGRAYVSSRDEGNTWMTVMDDEYEKVTSNSTYEWSTFT